MLLRGHCLMGELIEEREDLGPRATCGTSNAKRATASQSPNFISTFPVPSHRPAIPRPVSLNSSTRGLPTLALASCWLCKLNSPKCQPNAFSPKPPHRLNDPPTPFTPPLSRPSDTAAAPSPLPLFSIFVWLFTVSLALRFRARPFFDPILTI